MCSGQGSQYYQMGRALYQSHAPFQNHIQTCDPILKKLLNATFSQIVFDPASNPSRPFDNLQQSHLALAVIQYSLALSLLEQDLRPDRLLGYSLGEIIAHMIAQSISLETGLSLISSHASAIQLHCQPGAMLAILAPQETINRLQSPNRFHLAAKNFPSHHVISCHRQNADTLEPALRQRQISFQRLPVNYGFHSPLIDPAENAFRSALAAIQPQSPAFEVLSASTTPPSTSPLQAWEATRNPLDFEKTLRSIEKYHEHGTLYIDLGPSGTLAAFVKHSPKTPKESQPLPTITPLDTTQNSLKAAQQAMRANQAGS